MRVKVAIGSLGLLPIGYALYLHFKTKPAGQTQKQKDDEDVQYWTSFLLGAGMIAYSFLG